MLKNLTRNWKNGRLLLTTFFVCAAAVSTASTSAAAPNGDDESAQAVERWTRTPKSPLVKVVKETCLSVVSIQGEKQCEVGVRGANRLGPQYDVYNGMGAGVVVDERGYILTNYHVVKGLLKLEIVTSDGERYRDVELIRNDVATDLAILKIKPKKPLQKIRMGRSSRVELAEDVFAVGNPYGYSCSITRGVVSALDRPLEVSDTLAYDSVVQTDAAINPGNSGGPLVNLDGEMIGLNAAVREEAENIAFAIPVDVVAEVAERMLRQSVAKMTHHGLKFRVVDSDMPDYPANGNGEDVLVVESVDPKSPAASAGVEPGDILTASNGYRLRSSLDFTCSLIGLGLADVAELEFERAGNRVETTLAFSGLSNGGRADEALAQTSRRNAVKTVKASRPKTTETASNAAETAAFVDAPTSGLLADEATETAEFSQLASDADSDETTFAAARTPEEQKRAESVWRELGLEIVPTSPEEYRRRYPKLQAVSIDEFNFAPNGGVSVVRVSPTGPLSSGAAQIQENDLIFGFGVGASKDGQLSVASLDNLYYIAQKKSELAKVDGGKARVYLIRGGRPYFLEIDLNQ